MKPVMIMDGILVIDKPAGMSSHDVVDVARRTFSTRRVGHAGTLDIPATGVLVLGINRGTKLLSYLSGDDKGYEFDIVFNVETDTLDDAGTITRTRRFEDFKDLDEVLKRFHGQLEQIPPAYSAVKVGGKKLYEYARAGEPIPEVPPRRVRIERLIRLSRLTAESDAYRARFRLDCSKGVFVRQLAADVAEALGTVAHASNIRRIRSGRFTLAEAWPFEALREGRIARLIPLAEALPYPAVKIQDAKAIKSGKPLTLDCEAERVRILDEDGGLLAIYRRTEGRFRPEKVL